MTSTKNKFISFILSFIMAFTVFGVLGTAQVNAAGDDVFTITLSTTPDENVTGDSEIKATQVAKGFTAEELNRLADVTNQKYMFSKDGKSANVFKVNKGVKLETLIKAAAGETADVNSYAGLKLWDAADHSKYYKKIVNFKDHMIADTYYYGNAEYNTQTQAIDFGEGTVVDPVLALEFEYATLDANTAGTKADDLTFVKDTQNNNRVFLGMLSEKEQGGFWSQTNSFGIDLISRDISTATVTVGKYAKTYDGKAKEPALTVTLGDAVLVQGTDYTVSYKNNTNAGTATATVTGINKYTGSVDKTFTIAQTKNPMAVKSVNKTFKAKKVKKKAQSYKAITVTNAQGTVTYTAKAANAKSKKALKFNNKNGKITVRKKTRKGTYKMEITITANGNRNFAKSTVTKTVTVKVK